MPKLRMAFGWEWLLVEKGLENYSGGQAGIGIAMETLIESTVRVTIRHSESAPIASVAATASFRRDEATGAERPLKPQAPDDPFMVRYPLNARANHPRVPPES